MRQYLLTAVILIIMAVQEVNEISGYRSDEICKLKLKLHTARNHLRLRII